MKKAILLILLCCYGCKPVPTNLPQIGESWQSKNKHGREYFKVIAVGNSLITIIRLGYDYDQQLIDLLSFEISLRYFINNFEPTEHTLMIREIKERR